jgi:hypothetical protein
MRGPCSSPAVVARPPISRIAGKVGARGWGVTPVGYLNPQRHTPSVRLTREGVAVVGRTTALVSVKPAETHPMLVVS